MADLFKIYTADYSKDGYDHGINDSKNHLTKNKFKFFKVLHPINYIWNFNYAFDTFYKNYNKGYLDGQRVNHEIYSTNRVNKTTNNIKGANMAGVDRYENHLNMVSEVKREILTLKRYLAEIDVKYKHQIDIAEATGFMTNYTDPLKDKYKTFSQKITDLTNMIERHERELEGQESRLERKINEARNH